MVSGSMPPMRCGVGDYTAKLADALGESGANVAVLTDVRAGGGPPGRYELHPDISGWMPWSAFRVISLIRRWKPDVVHIQYPTRGYGWGLLPWFLPALGAALGVRVVLTWHESYRSLRRSVRNWLNAAVGGGLIVVRPNFLETLSAPYRRLIAHKIFRIIPNASAIPRADISEERRLAIARELAPGRKLVVYFGFASPPKGIEFVFDAADPERDHIVLACDLRESDPYERAILQRTLETPWLGHSTVLGFQEVQPAAELLAAADAVVLPFRTGGGAYNTSITAAMLQGSFVLTTSTSRSGYDESENVYYAAPDDVAEMRRALTAHIGVRNPNPSPGTSWSDIARAHLELYETVIAASHRVSRTSPPLHG